MKMTFLGPGGAFSRRRQNYHNNVLLESEGKKYLIDCGTTALESLGELGHDIMSLDGVVITHHHADHIGGLEELGYQGYFVGDKRFELYAPALLVPSEVGSEGIDLWDNSLRAGMEPLQDREGNPLKATLATYFDVHPVPHPEAVVQLGGVKIAFFKTDHVPDMHSFGLMLESETGTRVFYSADTTSTSFRHLPEFDIVFHDCSFRDHYPATVHTHFEELISLPPVVRSKTYLMHYGDIETAPKDLHGMQVVRRHQAFEL